MSDLSFVKYSGLGNDFILFDRAAFYESIERENISQWIVHLCHRRRSIGADGIVLYEKSSNGLYFLDFFNSDGSQVPLCGNGLRCAAHYLYNKAGSNGEIAIETKNFVHRCKIDKDIVTCSMQTPLYFNSYSFDDLKFRNWHLLECGVPHLIAVLDGSIPIREADITSLGRTLQRRKELPFETVNVSLIEPKTDTSEVYIRTYERGVFEETEACGTAAMCAAALLTKSFPPKDAWRVHFVGFGYNEAETLEVTIGTECTMKAKVQFVYEGILVQSLREASSIL